MPIADLFVSSWPLDGDFLDYLGSNDLTDNNTVGSGTGLVNATAADFESGNAEYLSCADNASLSTEGQHIFIEAWVKTESHGANSVVTKDSDSGREFTLDLAAGTPRFYINGGGGGLIVQWGSALSTGTWYQICAGLDIDADVLWISVNNGTRVTQATGGATAPTTGAMLQIGSRDRASERDYYDGLAGPVRFGKTTPTDAQRTALYNSGNGLTEAQLNAGFTISRSALLIGSGTVQVTLTGSGTSWTGSPFSLTSTPSGWSISSQNVISGTSATVTLNRGSGTGTLTISDGTYDNSLTVLDTATTVATGNWSSGSTWDAEEAPGVGHKAILANSVTVDVDTSLGTSPSDTTTNVLTCSTPGVDMTVAATKTFTLKGNASFDNSTGSKASPVRLVLAATGAFEFDSSDAGTPPHYIFKLGTHSNGDSRLLCSGTNGNRCSVSSVTTGGGLSGRFTTASNEYGGAVDAAYTDFADIGDATNDAIQLSSQADLSIDHCTLTNCGRIIYGSGAGLAASIEITFSTWRLSADTVTVEAGTSGGTTTGTRVVEDNSFDVRFAVAAKACSIERNLFLGGHSSTGSQHGGGTFADNLVRQAVNDPVARYSDWSGVVMVIDGSTLDLTDGTYSATANVNNPHWTNPTGAAGIYAVTDALFEDFGSTDDGDVDYGPNSSGFDSAFLRCIGISQALANPGTLSTFNGWSGQNDTSYEHCTWQTSQVGPVVVGEAGVGFAGMLASYRSNIFWRNSYDADVFKLGSYNTGSLVDDIVAAALCDYNCGHNVNVTTGVGGNGYNLPFSSGTPGANDVDVDPQFVDSTRNFSTWVESLEGPTLPGNATPSRTDYNAYGLWKLSLKNLTSDPDYDASYTLSAYLTYVRAGFAPQNAALQDAGHDAVTIGAVEFQAAVSGKPNYYHAQETAVCS